MILRLLKIFSISLLLLVVLSVKSAYALPKPEGHVNDFADVLSSEFEASLEEKLASFSAKTGPEIAVVTIKNLEGDTVENYAVELFNEWDIGKKDADNGVLFIAAITERKMRIEVGYGVEDKLNDAKAGRIIRNTITPEFKKEDYEKGIDKGVSSMIASLKGETDEVLPELGETKTTQAFNIVPFIFFAAAFAYLAAYFARSKSWWAGGVVGFVIGIFASLTIGFILGLIGLILDFILSKNFKKLKKAHKPTGFWPTKGGFWTGGGRSSGGFGGFSGGRSGGGGASGSW